jgi:hypothetical protein
VAAPEPLSDPPAGAPVLALRGAALGAEGQAQIAALCTASQGAPLALIVFMPPGSGDAGLRLARRMLAAVREGEGPAARQREGGAQAQ